MFLRVLRGEEREGGYALVKGMAGVSNDPESMKVVPSAPVPTASPWSASVPTATGSTDAVDT